jgi:DNA-binding transcriptional MerR regulator
MTALHAIEKTIEKSPEAYRTISEAAIELDLPQHVLRFWETRFTQIRPMKRAGGRRFYRPEDVDFLKGIRAYLYGQGMTIRGLQKIIKDQGIAHVIAYGQDQAFVEKPKALDIIAKPVDLTRTRARLERKEAMLEEQEPPPLKQPVYARHLIESLSQRLEPTSLSENTMSQTPAIRTSFSPKPVAIPNGSSAVSNGRGLSQPITQSPSPLVKFHPLEDEQIPPFIHSREPLPSERAPVYRLSENEKKQLNTALYELNSCRDLLNMISS